MITSYPRSLLQRILGVLLLLIMPFVAAGTANGGLRSTPQQQTAAHSTVDHTADATEPKVKTSHRLIVQFDSPPLAEVAAVQELPRLANGRLNVKSAAAQQYIAQLAAEQAAFVATMQTALPNASVSTYRNELGQDVQATYQLVFNGLAVDPGTRDTAKARATLAALPGVKAVYYDYAYTPDMYASLPLINAQAAWNHASIGGMDAAGRGVKVASMDGGIHKDAPMFDGTGYSYPPDFPAKGLGLTENNNGKIIASRAYFRSWDPPAPGDENPWPGQQGTSHGVHTAGTAAGNPVTANYLGVEEPVSGVAPAAWVMSYRMFYESINGITSFYTAEGIAALEDIAADGADVLNNSWGGGPSSVGGEDDPLDQALLNTARSGVFIAMSAGNSGPGNGTTDHPSSEYISVAASTTAHMLAAGRVNVSAPEPISPTLQGIEYAAADFGAAIPSGQELFYSYTTAAAVDPDNFEGCTAWPEGVFNGKAVLISRGSCQFGLKVLHAQQAGAAFVVIYNHASGGDALVSMAGGQYGDQVEISSIFVGHTAGTKLVEWHATHGDATELELNTFAFKKDSEPDVIASFSSRGPGVGNVLKPDITAPGVNILSQGYTPNAQGEARHLGYGQASGTSMAAPHVAGAAALLRQIHPDWPNHYIKSALMSTSKYLDIYTHSGGPAQPLDMGAGRLDLTNAADPGLILDPPSLSFGVVPTDTVKTIEVRLTSVADETETYTVSTLFTGNGFDSLTEMPGVSVSPAAVTLAPGQTKTIEVTFDAGSSQGIGDNQGFVVLTGANHEAHMPAWARVTPEAPAAEILVLDADLSPAFDDYRSYYTGTLELLGHDHDVWDVYEHWEDASRLPHPAVMSGYKAVVFFTGDSYVALDEAEVDRLTEYANGGGTIIAMGQDLSTVLRSAVEDNGHFFYNQVLGANYLQDSLTGEEAPSAPIANFDDVPPLFRDIELDVRGIDKNTVALSGANEVPPVTTTTTGTADLSYNVADRLLSYAISIHVNEPITLTAAHVHQGAAGEAGPALYALPIPDAPVVVTQTFEFAGEVAIAEEHDALLRDGGLYINVHSGKHPSGEIRGQVAAALNGDGAGNQVYIDEIQPHPPFDEGEPTENARASGYLPLLKYTDGAHALESGAVAVAHRAQPSLEQPGITYFGRSVYASFGLEGVHEGTGSTARAELLRRFLDWAWDEPTLTIADTTPADNASNLTTVEATFTSPTGAEALSYRWDFGDGSAYAEPSTRPYAGHTYQYCGNYTVRVEVSDSFGNRTVASRLISVTEQCQSRRVLLPLILR